GLLMTALIVKYRDFCYVIQFLIHFVVYASPVGFSSSVFRERFGETGYAIYSLNPLVGIFDGYGCSILGPGEFYLNGLSISCCYIADFLVLGVWYFRRTEQSFADVI